MRWWDVQLALWLSPICYFWSSFIEEGDPDIRSWTLLYPICLNFELIKRLAPSLSEIFQLSVKLLVVVVFDQYQIILANERPVLDNIDQWENNICVGLLPNRPQNSVSLTPVKLIMKMHFSYSYPQTLQICNMSAILIVLLIFFNWYILKK